ncbi:MAG: hypothetical protein QF707_07175 [Candidatus Poseidoniaceae archaeon]|jgi:hypothetical protein|nr:hypothetical protein [Candidatus Poseidoniaceae archaeon]
MSNDVWDIRTQRLWVLSIIVPVTSILLSYILHQATGHARIWLPFISETDHAGPEAWTFKFGLAVTGVLDIIVTWRMWEILRSKSEQTHWFVHASLVSGIATGIGGLGVACFRWTSHMEEHLLFAIMIFIGGTTWAIFIQLSGRLLELDERGAKIRRIAIPITVISLILMTTLFKLAINEHPEIKVELNLDLERTTMLFSAFFEWIVFLGFMLSMYSFRWDLIPLQTSEPEP